MRISDWSSDVCSSDLRRPVVAIELEVNARKCRHRAAGAEQARLPEPAGKARGERRHRFGDDLAHPGISGAPGARAVGLADMFGQRDDAPGRRMPVEHARHRRSEEHTSELQSLMRISYAVFCLKKKNKTRIHTHQYTAQRVRKR